jgi:hypothetical protein
LDVQGDSFRLMVGETSLSAPGKVLKLGEWQHVAATFDFETRAMGIFLNGKSVAKNGANAIYPERESINIGKANTLQRYMQACAGRGGDFPIKFNGSIFTVEPTVMGRKECPDFRRWGDCNWLQNIRMPYHAMQVVGDFDLMMPFFNMMESYRVFGEARTKLYFNAEGCFFSETMTPWGTYANNDYGWDRTGKEPKDVNSIWVRHIWNQGLETVSLTIDYYDCTQAKIFLENRLLPMATSVLKFFDTRFRKDADGRIVIDPTQSKETYRIAVNDTPCVAGLNHITARLCALPATAMSAAQRAFYQKMKAAAPTIPIKEAKLDGKTVRKIAVAQTYKDERSNGENPE